jgi:hypothetical protein
VAAVVPPAEAGGRLERRSFASRYARSPLRRVAFDDGDVRAITMPWVLGSIPEETLAAVAVVAGGPPVWNSLWLHFCSTAML